MELSDFEALSFDCYGTLIDWEAGIGAVFAAWVEDEGLDLGRDQLLATYAAHEARVARETPTLLYPEVLARAFQGVGEQVGHEVSDTWAERLGASVPDWPAFPDSPEALQRLSARYRLIILSNVHREGFAGSNRRLGVEFDAIITAEDVGAYKPADHHFRRLDAVLAELDVPRARLLHVAQSLFHDHAPARRLGLTSAWINRRHDRPGWGATPEPAEEYGYAWEFPTLAAFADAALDGAAEGP
jgi:2-haloacid dehalogenase